MYSHYNNFIHAHDQCYYIILPHRYSSIDRMWSSSCMYIHIIESTTNTLRQVQGSKRQDSSKL